MRINFDVESRQPTESLAAQRREQGYPAPYQPTPEYTHNAMEAVHRKADALVAPSLLGDLEYEQDEAYFTKDQEQQLAAFIQAGKIAEEQLADDPTNDELRVTAERGAAARTALFETNIPFALYFARESVGITHAGSYAKLNAGRKGRLWGTSSGTYRPLHSNKSPYADLEHRQQSALLGLWIATDTFLPSEQKNRTSRFVSYAAYRIQFVIEHDIDHEEHNGVRYPTYVRQSIQTYLGNNPSEDPADMDPAMTRLLELARVPMNIEEYSQQFEHDTLEEPSEDDRAISLADYYGEPLNEHFTHDIEREMGAKALDAMFDKLSERESGILSMRFGLVDGIEKTLEDTGRTYGVSKERVRQILSRTLHKLRYPYYADALQTYLDIDEPLHSAMPQQDGRAAEYLRDPHGILGQNSSDIRDDERFKRKEQAKTLEEYYADQERQSWQAFQGDIWDAPVRQKIVDVIRPDEAITPQQRQAMQDVVRESSAYAFSQHIGRQSGTEFPASVFQRIVHQAKDNVLLEQDIDELYWLFVSEKMPLAAKKLGDDMSYERVKGLFDALYARYVVVDEDDNDSTVFETRRAIDELVESRAR